MDKATAIVWIGEMYLEASAPTERLAIGRSEFLNGWKDLLPESWRKEASINSLPVRSETYPCVTAYLL
jgi:sister chromatid cohesion protein DCC1